MNTKAKLLLIKLRLNVIFVHYFCNFFFITIKVSLLSNAGIIQNRSTLVSFWLLFRLSPTFRFVL